MSYGRVTGRNGLRGGYYDTSLTDGKHMIAGDLRRLEADQRDDYHLGLYAAHTGLTPEQVKAVLDLFFNAQTYVSGVVNLYSKPAHMSEGEWRIYYDNLWDRTRGKIEQAHRAEIEKNIKEAETQAHADNV